MGCPRNLRRRIVEEKCGFLGKAWKALKCISLNLERWHVVDAPVIWEINLVKPKSVLFDQCRGIGRRKVIS